MAAPDAARATTSLTIDAPTFGARLIGLGSVFGKSLRDARWAILSAGGLLGLIVIVSAAALAAEFDTVLERQLLAAQMATLPAVFQGLLGEPIRIDTLGGFLSWRILNFLPVMLGIWSLVALSGTLAGELARGSLEFVAAAPLARARIAIEKAAAHVVAVGSSLLILAVITWASIVSFAALPGDAIGLDAAVGHSAWLLVTTLVPGALAFAIAPAVGRGTALGIGAVALVGSYVVNGYAGTVPAFDAIRGLSYFFVTAQHRPLAGSWDWSSVGALGAFVVILLGVGVLAFSRRDLIVPTGSRLPTIRLGFTVAGPFARSFAERLPAALAWGAALGLYGLTLATSADEFAAQLSQIPQIIEMIQRIYPDADLLSTGGFLQLAFFESGLLFVGLAAAAFVSGWASEETERRLEVVLGAPLSRAMWAIKSGLGVLGAVAVLTLLTAVGVAIGAVVQGGEVAQPTIGVLVIGAYAGALSGIGLAVGGLVRPSLAGPVTVGLGLGFYLFELIGSILRLPEQVLNLALNRHLGQPIIGVYDGPGLLVCAVLAFGGLAVGAIGLRRRDIGR
jgi:ABC-2 type transport system permease protein